MELLSGGQASLSLKGSYKTLFFDTKRQATNTNSVADLNRLRTEWGARYKILSAKVIWDHEVIGGNFVNSEEFAARQVVRNTPYLNMDYELVHKNSFFYGQNFYRAYAELDPGPFHLTVGRQKVDWGVMRMLSPADLFTPLSIFDVEREEKVGVTAANLMVPVTSSLRIHSLYAFDPGFDRSRVGGRITKTIGRFDVSVLGGRFFRDGILGFDFSGDVHKVGVRGELIYDWADVGKSFVQCAGGVDYGFKNSFYFALEYFHNGQGTNQAMTSLPFTSSAAQIRSIHQNFASLMLKYDVTPLWILMFQNIVDFNAGSLFINPEMKYSLFQWLDLSGGAQLPVGKTGGEFTALPNTYYLQSKVFF